MRSIPYTTAAAPLALAVAFAWATAAAVIAPLGAGQEASSGNTAAAANHAAPATAAGMPASAVSASTEGRASPADSVRAHARAMNVVRTYLRRARPNTARDMRPDVVEQLDAYGREIPGDDWIIGHRVGMRVKQGWFTAAANEAVRCQGTAWWCSALAGMALHWEGSHEEAHQAFDRALAEMPRATRCQWAAELVHVLDGATARSYGAANCDERIAMEDRIWWLADPLHVMPGNDRRSEHYARLVSMHLHHELLAAEGREPCSHDHHSGVIRHGWPEWWWGPGLPETGREGARFMPRDAAFDAPLEAAPDAWDVETDVATERYAPGYGTVRNLEHQVAFFLDRDSILAVAAATFGRTRLGGVAFTRNETEPPRVIRAPEGGALVLAGRLPVDAWVVSIESMREPSGVVRARFGHRLPDATEAGLRLSDIVLVSWVEALQPTLESVAPRMLPTTRFARSRPVALYWEVYGVSDTTAVDIALSAEPDDPGLLARIGQSLRLATPRDGVAVRWQEQGDEPGILRSQTRIDFSSLPAGRYVLRLEISQGDGPPAVARRAIELVDP
ncbi:MAG TPA: hypothetical protein VK929_09250 [Longimicrobiales bacterium]|nr:hypothetical protein [Longimicrobiales bacterium]